MANINLKDQSADKKYFTQLPNIILNHSTANDQALYLQMKRYAGEDSKCFATEKTLMRKLGIGKKAYDNSLKYLLNKKWIRFEGFTDGKTRPIKTYSIVDIWKVNILEYEKISAESNISFEEEISSESRGDKFQKQHKISAESNVEEEHSLKKNHEEDSECGDKSPTPQQIAKNFFESRDKQIEVLLELQNKYGQNDLMGKEIKKFVEYWTEPNKSGTKQRWELQPTFEIGRRFATWLRNIKQFQGRKDNIPKLIKIK